MGEPSNEQPKVETGSFPTSSHDVLNHLITDHKLNGQNYTQWERSVKIFLQGKGREGYITGDTKCPEEGNATCPKWQLEDSQVKSNLHDLRQGKQTMLYAGKSGTVVVAQRGNFLHALNTSKEKTKSWIVDSGASDHMTGDFNLFNDYSPCPFNFTVRIADDTHSKVMGTGSIILSPNITLESVLYVPKLDCNLLSISKITRDLKCVTKFFHNLCEF
jgi:hypothetical protein